MKITDLKDALRKLNLTTTGNKTELKMRLQGALPRKHQTRAGKAERIDGATNDEATSSDESATDDEAVKLIRQARVSACAGASANEKRRIPTKRERALPESKQRNDDGSPDTDVSIELWAKN